ncbi:PAS domain S-box protein [Mariniphaga sediminis]|jgi:PAS domain S-box-containing protein|uniref:PAS domain S-box protein n=1 Tax=Mariniphaga sediminis TaxID=1628158 RepID=UPI003563CD2D
MTKSISQKLDKSKDLCYTFLNATSDMAFLKDETFRYVFVNRNYAAFFNKKEKEIVGKTDFDLMDYNGATTCRATDQQTLDEAEPVLSEEIIDNRIYETRKFPVKLKNGETGIGGYIRDVTQQRQTQENWNKVFNTIKDAIVLIDNENRILQYNESFHRLVKGKGNDLQKHFCYEIVHGQKCPVENCPFTRVLKSRKQEREEINLGDSVFEVVVDPIFDPEEKLIGAVHIISNITERRKSEDALREREAQYRALANSGTVMIWTAGTDKLVNYFNDPWLKFTGRPLKHELGNGWAKGVHPEDLEYCLNTYYKAFDKRTSFNMEYRVRHADGNYRWIQDFGSPNYNYKGEFIGYIGNCFDVSERKSMEQQIVAAKKTAEETEQYSAIAAQISAELIDVNAKNFDKKIQAAITRIGRFAQVDRSYIFLLRENGTKMDNTHEWCAPDIEPEIQNLRGLSSSLFPWWMRKLRRKKYICISNIKNMPPAAAAEKEILASQNILSVLVVPIFIGDELLGFMGFDSVQKEKTWENHIIEILKSVASAIASALDSLRYQKQLLAAKEKAEESERLKSAFLTNMSHEIRTPMNGILGFIDLLQNNDLPRIEQSAYLKLVKQSSDRLLNTINDIIEISKIESGQIPMDISNVNIKKTMDFLFNFFRTEALKKGLEMKLSFDPKNEPFFLKTDKTKLESILSNFIKNALKFTTDGYVELGYTMKKNDLLFYVKDTGRGIPSSRFDVIFKRFVQGHMEISRPYEGSGLGLAIAHAYANMLGGSIKVESVEGKGSTFYFSVKYS